MAPKKNPEAVKAAKQKKMLIGLGVLLAAVGAFQAPKLLGGSKPATEAAATSTTGDAAESATGAGATPTPNPTSEALPPPVPAAPLLPGEAAKKAPTATLVGVRIATGSTVRATEGQLASFSLFKPKDPFKPQQVETKAETPVAPEPSKAAEVKPSGPSGPTVKGSPATAPVVGPSVPATDPAIDPAAPVAPVVAPTFATISVNGIAESLELGGVFPELSKLFVLAKVKPKGVEIGIAGGRLEQGKTAAVKVGKTITLVDSASGVRYVIEILSVGTQPDLEFTTTAPVPAGAAGPVAPAPTPTP
jgi:hypothetical protein